MGTQKSSNFNCLKMSDSESNDEFPQLLPDNIVLRDWQKRVVNWAMRTTSYPQYNGKNIQQLFQRIWEFSPLKNPLFLVIPNSFLLLIYIYIYKCGLRN